MRLEIVTENTPMYSVINDPKNPTEIILLDGVTNCRYRLRFPQDGGIELIKDSGTPDPMKIEIFSHKTIAIK